MRKSGSPPGGLRSAKGCLALIGLSRCAALLFYTRTTLFHLSDFAF